jgi:hypothetical protein
MFAKDMKRAMRGFISGIFAVIIRGPPSFGFFSSMKAGRNALKDEDFDVTSATTLDEVLALGKAGWQKYDEITFNSVTYHCYRKPKRFGLLRKNWCGYVQKDEDRIRST